MDGPALKDLPYGHFGQVLYDNQEKRWIFGRRIKRQSTFNVLGEWEKIIDGHYVPEPPGDIKRSQPQIESTKMGRPGIQHFSHIPEVHPSLSGLESLLRPELIASWAVASSLHVYDPSVGDLLAVSNVPGGLLTNKRVSSVFACPGGESGSVLRLMETYLRDCSISTSIEEELQRLKIAYPTDNDFWSDHQGHTIRQIIFSPQDDRQNRFLGVRSMTNTTIYKIEVAHRFRSNTLRDAAFQPSELYVQQIFNIPINATRNTNHSDIMFNPWVLDEVAVIDRYGTWFVFKVQESQEEPSQGQVMPMPLYHGSLIPTRDETSKPETRDLEAQMLGEDGWARIRWVFNGKHLLLCRRRISQLVELNVKRRLDIILGPQDDETWNLDVRIGTEHKGHVFLLTNRKLFWIQLVANGPKKKRKRLEYKVLFSIWHFRDPKDMTLKMKVLEVKGETIIFLFSRRSSSLTCYTLSYSDDQLSLPILASDPFQLTFPCQRNDSGSSAQIHDLLIRQVKRSIPLQDEASLEDLNRVYELVLLLNNGSIWRSLLGPWGDCTWKYSDRPRHSSGRFPSGFIISESIGLTPFGSKTINPPIPEFAVDEYELRARKLRDGQFKRPGYDMRLVYEQFIDLRSPICSANVTNKDISSRNFATVFSDFQQIINGPDYILDPSATLFLLCDMPYNITDVDAAYHAFSQLTSAVTSRDPPFPMSSVLPNLLTTINLVSLETAYDSLAAHFITTLDANVPLLLRAEKRKMAQTIAAEICLSMLKLTPRFRTAEARAELRFPFHGTIRAAKMEPSDLQRASLLRPLSNASIETAMPYPMQSAALFSVLGKYVRFTKPLPRAFLELDRSVPHWELGADPDLYDYVAYEREEAQQRELAEMTEKQREASLKRERTRKRKIQRESQRFEQNSQVDSLQGLVELSQPDASQTARGTPQGSLLRNALARDRVQRDSQLASQQTLLPTSMPHVEGILALRPTLPDSRSETRMQSQEQIVSHSQSQSQPPRQSQRQDQIQSQSQIQSQIQSRSQIQGQSQSQGQKKRRRKGF